MLMLVMLLEPVRGHVCLSEAGQRLLNFPHRGVCPLDVPPRLQPQQGELRFAINVSMDYGSRRDHGEISFANQRHGDPQGSGGYICDARRRWFSAGWCGATWAQRMDSRRSTFGELTAADGGLRIAAALRRSSCTKIETSSRIAVTLMGYRVV